MLPLTKIPLYSTISGLVPALGPRNRRLLEGVSQLQGETIMKTKTGIIVPILAAFLSFLPATMAGDDKKTEKQQNDGTRKNDAGDRCANGYCENPDGAIYRDRTPPADNPPAPAPKKKSQS